MTPDKRFPDVSTLLAVAALAVGLACFTLLEFAVVREHNYDRFVERADRVHRLTVDLVLPGQPVKQFATAAPPIAAAVREEFPEVTQTARLKPYFEGGRPGKAALSWRGKTSNVVFFWADRSILDVFEIPGVAGDREAMLRGPNSVVVSEYLARRLFGDDDPIGEMVTIDAGYMEDEYQVTGVVEDMPGDSHFGFDVLGSFATLEGLDNPRVILDDWWMFDTWTYLELEAGVPPERVQARFPELVEKRLGEVAVRPLQLQLQPLTDIHLRSHRQNELRQNARVSAVDSLHRLAVGSLVLGVLAFLVAWSSRPEGTAGTAKERWTDPLAAAGAGLLGALVLTALGYLTSGPLLGAGQVFRAGTGLPVLGVVALAAISAGLMAGVLSTFRARRRAEAAPWLRALVAAGALAVALGLLVCAGAVLLQLRVWAGTDLGFDPETVVVLPFREDAMPERYRGLRDELAKTPGVKRVTFSSMIPGNEPPDVGVLAEGLRDWRTLDTIAVEHGFLDVMGLRLIAGRDFSYDEPTDVEEAFIVSRSAVELLGWGTPEEAIGKDVQWGAWKEGEVIGVIEDFHHLPLQEEVQPLLVHLRPQAYSYVVASIPPVGVQGTLGRLEERWRQVAPDRSFEPTILADHLAGHFRDERLLAGVLSVGGVVAAFLAFVCLASFVRNLRGSTLAIAVWGGLVPLVLATGGGLFLALDWIRSWLGRLPAATAQGPLTAAVAVAGTIGAVVVLAALAVGRGWRPAPVRTAPLAAAGEVPVREGS